MPTITRPLPVWPTVRQAYVDVFVNWRLVLQAAGLWAALIVLVQGGWTLFTGRAVGAVAAPLWLNLVVVLLWIVGFGAVASFWHRHVLLGDGIKGISAPFGRRAGRYLLYALMLGLFTALPVMLLVVFGSLFGAMAGMAQESEGLAAGIGGVVGVIGLALALVLATRMQLALPAIAVDGPHARLGDSWALTKGNTLRLLACMGLQSLVAFPISLGIAFLTLPLAALGLEVAVLILATLANFFFIAVGAAWMSLAYRYLSSGTVVPNHTGAAAAS